MNTGREATANEQAGMDWWNALSEKQRARWLREAPCRRTRGRPTSAWRERADPVRRAPVTDGDAAGGTAGMLVGMGWYRPEDWERLLQVVSDRGQLHDSYAEWLAEAEWGERNVSAAGHKVVRVFVDPDELAGWCLVRGRAPDAAARAEFVTDKMGRGGPPGR